MIVNEFTYLRSRIVIYEIKNGKKRQYVAHVNDRILRSTSTLESAEMLAKHIAGDRDHEL